MDEIRTALLTRGEELFEKPFEPVQFTGDEAADQLLNDLTGTPHAFVLACIMDRQMKAERAWMVPCEYQKRLGSFGFETLATLSPEDIKGIMAGPPSLHRYPDRMAEFFYLGVRRIADSYDGDASRIWSGSPSSAAVVRRFLEFDGVGPKIGTMAANILAREMKIPMSDLYSIDISPDVHVRRVFTRLGLMPRRSDTELLIFRAREMNPDYPGIFDLPAFEIGRNWCRPKNPLCSECYLSDSCPTAKAQEGDSSAS